MKAYRPSEFPTEEAAAPPDHEEWIERYAALVEAGIPLFEGTPVEGSTPLDEDRIVRILMDGEQSEGSIPVTPAASAATSVSPREPASLVGQVH